MKIKGIAVRKTPGAPMQLLQSALLSESKGVVGDARGKPGNRQVTLLSEALWQTACDSLGVELHWTSRRANILVDNLPCGPDMVGKQIELGEAVLQVTGETDPCHKMDRIHDGLQAALRPHWRGGLCCRVVAEGEIWLEDDVDMLN